MAAQQAESRAHVDLQSTHQVPPVRTGSIEKQQEEELRAKYPTVGLKGSSILQKKMQSKVKYFDSGDYNMALSKQMARARGNQQPTATSPTSSPKPNLPPVSSEDSSAITGDAAKSMTPPNSPSDQAVRDTSSYKDVKMENSHQTGFPSNQSVSSGASSPGPHTSGNSAAQHNTPGVAVMLSASAPVAQELLQQQVSHNDEDADSTDSGKRVSRSDSIREVTGDTMATPENVVSVARKKSLLNQMGRSTTGSGFSPVSITTESRLATEEASNH